MRSDLQGSQRERAISTEDLRAAFRARKLNAPPLTAQSIFADRDDEQAVFWSALDQHRAWHREQWAPALMANDGSDLSLGRRNVIVYHGVGGIGKTSLSQRLEALLLEDAERRESKIATFRWDLGEPGAQDFESFVFGLRTAMGGLGRPLRAFDLLMSRYWALAHPGEELQNYVARNSLFGRAATATGLVRRIDKVLAEVGSTLMSSSTLYSAGAAAARKVFQAAREAQLVRQMCEASAYFDVLLDAEPDGDMLAYMAAIMAWDLLSIDQEDIIDLVAFVDTYEATTQDELRAFERLFQRVLFLTPNILWVITGRNRLDWDDETLEGKLDYVGVDCWPQLAGGSGPDSRQHLVGFLSDHDADDYLARRVTLRDRSAIPQSLRDTIVRAAKGLPLHLDLAVMRYMKVAGLEGEVDIDEFEVSFGVLVDRIMRDLPHRERLLLEATSLLENFDQQLASATVGSSIADAEFRRFVQRPFVVTASSTLWPYRIHDSVRACLNDHADATHGRWSEHERRSAAARAFAEVGQQVSPAVENRDRFALFAGLRQGLSLASQHGLDIGWLTDAAIALHETSSWQAVLPDDLMEGTPDNPAKALALGLAVVSRRRTTTKGWLVSRLDDVLNAGMLEGDLADLFTRYRSHALRRLLRHDEALEGYQAIMSRGGRLAPEAEWNIVRHYEATGRFQSALDVEQDRRPLRAGLRRVFGNVLRDNALFQDAEDHYVQAVEAAEHAGESGRRAHCLSDLALVRAWQDAPDLDRDMDRAREAATGTGRRQPYQQAALAAAIAAAGRDEPLLMSQLAEYRRLSRAASMAENELFASVAEALHATLINDHAMLGEAATAIDQQVEQIKTHGFWSTIVNWWAGRDDPEPDRYEWVGGHDAARQRWTAVLQNRRS